jgi:hypothetical protein
LEILRLLETGTVTADEAGTLLDALDEAERQPPLPTAEAPNRSAAGRPRQVRIRITERATDRTTVNLVVPLGLVDAGLKVGRRFAPEHLPPPEAIRDAIAGGFRGSLLDVDDGRERVEIVVE